MRMALTLLDFAPGAMVRIACRYCDRKGQYRRETLIERFGASEPLPNIRNELAQCPREGKASSPCGSYFVDLAPPGWKPGL